MANFATTWSQALGSVLGAIFDKELRTASRRRRSYLIRTGYLVALGLYVMLAWEKELGSGVQSGGYVPPGTSGEALVATRMADVGRGMSIGIIQFQFIATQIVALILMSTAVSSEVYHKTLPTLLSTPLTMFQLVTGKLLSQLLQVMLLLLISLPLLALLRAFGGMTATFLISAGLLNVGAVLLAGAISLYGSIRPANSVRQLFGVAGLYAAVCVAPFSPCWIFWGLVATDRANSAGGIAMLVGVAVYVGILLLIVFFILRAAAQKTREIALGNFGVRAMPALPMVLPVSFASANPTRRIQGPALLWKDMRFFLPSSRRKLVLMSLGFVAAMSISYLSFAGFRLLGSPEVNGFYLLLYLGTGVIVTTLMGSTSLTVEKESRALTVLLTTPMSDRYIVWTKAWAVIQYGMPCWILVVAHLGGMAAAGYMDPLGAFCLLWLAAGMLALSLGWGLYVSSILRTSTAAVSAAFAGLIAFWVLLPWLGGMLSPEWGAVLRTGNAFAQMGALIRASCHDAMLAGRQVNFTWSIWSPLASRLAGGCEYPVGRLALVVIPSSLLYGLVGLLLANRGKVLMRRRLFA